MFLKIKKKIDKNLSGFLAKLDKDYSLSSISPILFNKIKDFSLRKGKRIRPILFIVGYQGYKNKSAAGLYQSALSIELLHNFMLIHDDIIDKSETRRGKPSMHAMFDNYLAKNKKAKFNGNDLGIVVGDIVYALAINAFLSIKENFGRKEKALRNFVKAAIFTGSGEFIELINGIKPLNKLKKSDIYKIYDYKTAFYTFSCPLSTGAILAGVNKKEIDKINAYGKCLGRAFQIKDDILGIFGDEKKTGKSQTSDLQEAKKTLLIFYAYNKSRKKQQVKIKDLLLKEQINKKDLALIQKLILQSNSLNLAKKDIQNLIKKSQKILDQLAMKKSYKKALNNYFLPLLTQE
ncbi:MAG: polyprenyl synthetase family protein [Candidatus Omnitrophica bacterium]|nr:polyprenyl synthetase family protein [Candidatus Omnitrophota bacterium]MCF7894350.1 polyprenyl synthetase family protein [Candidatus Omnitrophota bacterium]